jgi:hypothetical protein
MLILLVSVLGHTKPASPSAPASPLEVVDVPPVVEVVAVGVWVVVIVVVVVPVLVVVVTPPSASVTTPVLVVVTTFVVVPVETEVEFEFEFGCEFEFEFEFEPELLPPTSMGPPLLDEPQAAIATAPRAPSASARAGRAHPFCDVERDRKREFRGRMPKIPPRAKGTPAVPSTEGDRCRRAYIAHAI